MCTCIRVHMYIYKLISSKYVLCFSVHFVTSFRDALDLEMKCISLDFVRWQHFTVNVKSLYFVDFWPKECEASYLSTLAAGRSQQY